MSALPRLSARPVPAPVIAIAVALLAALLGLATASPAAAHGALVSSDPPASGVVEVLPSRAVLTFSDPVESIREIAVTGPDGSVTNGDPSSSGPEVRQNLWSGPDGVYTMSYYVVGSDGHEIRGEVQFEVGAVSSSTADQISDQASGEGAAPGGGGADGGTRVAVPVVVVLLAGATALALTRLRSRRRTV